MKKINRTFYTTYMVKPYNGICSIFALDNWLLILPIPVLQLSCQLKLNYLQMPRVMIPRVVTIHTDDVHIWCLGQEH